jgi:hypothetical protein
MLKIMKKMIYVLPILMLCLTGCNKANTENTKTDNKSITCTYSSKDVVNNYQTESQYVINYSGSDVESVNTTETVTSDSEEVLDYIESSLNQTYEATNSAYGGYTYEVTNEDGKVTSIVTIDYNEMDLEQFVTDQPTLKNYVKNGKMQVSGIKALYESLGATCE